MAKATIIVNRGTRTYHLVNGKDGETRTLPPGGSIECVDEKESKHLLRYHDLQDISKASPQTAAKIKAHEDEIERLKAENERLKEQHRVATEGSIEEMNEESAGTGFRGPGGPVGTEPAKPDLDSDPTHQPTATSEKAQKDAERSLKDSGSHKGRR